MMTLFNLGLLLVACFYLALWLYKFTIFVGRWSYRLFLFPVAFFVFVYRHRKEIPPNRHWYLWFFSSLTFFSIGIHLLVGEFWSFALVPELLGVWGFFVTLYEYCEKDFKTFFSLPWAGRRKFVKNKYYVVGTKPIPRPSDFEPRRYSEFDSDYDIIIEGKLSFSAREDFVKNQYPTIKNDDYRTAILAAGGLINNNAGSSNCGSDGGGGC